jgi:hypothetical protein
VFSKKRTTSLSKLPDLFESPYNEKRLIFQKRYSFMAARFLLLSIFILFFTPAKTFAQDAKIVVEDLEAPSQTAGHTYETPTVATLSKLYWRIGKMDINKPAHINEFLRINECDIYQDYIHNEFEWKKIYASAKSYLKSNSDTFPLRFQAIQPLRLGEYNFEEKAFEIVEDYSVDGIRKLEVLANNFYSDICNLTYRNHIPDYPKGLVVELSRPINLQSIPMEPDKAENFIQQGLIDFRKYKKKMQTHENLHENRQAFLVLKMKAFSYQGETSTRDGYKLANVLAVLEGVEIYADEELKDLLYEESYRKKRKRSEEEMALKKRYEERIKKRKEEQARKKKEREEEAAKFQ